MSDNSPAVRFRCASKNCRHAGDAPLADLVGGGCPICGSKRLEVWHPHKGHILIDYRSPKSTRKRRRRELAALGMGILFAAWLVGCSPAPLDDQKADETLEGASVTGRSAPSVSWSFFGYDSICGRPMVASETFGGEMLDRGRPVYEGGGFEVTEPETFRLYLAAVEPSDSSIQLFRIEWAPSATGDTCFYPIGFPMLHHGQPAGIISFRVSGAIAATDSTRGDDIHFWRSHPWPAAAVANMESTLCMKVVYPGGP